METPHNSGKVYIDAARKPGEPQYCSILGVEPESLPIGNAKGWKQLEPGDPYPIESTERLERWVIRGLTEETISEPRAAELLGMPLSEFWKQASKQHDGLPLPIYH